MKLIVLWGYDCGISVVSYRTDYEGFRPPVIGGFGAGESRFIF
jgi:hypothetical protein